MWRHLLNVMHLPPKRSKTAFEPAEWQRLSSAISEFEAEAKTDQRVGMARLEAVSSERDALQNQVVYCHGPGWCSAALDRLSCRCHAGLCLLPVPGAESLLIMARDAHDGDADQA